MCIGTKSTREIITDEEVIRVHGNANFGGQPPRDVVDETVIKFALGYHSGSTAMSIVIEHGLATAPRKTHQRPNLTKKGWEYMRAMFGGSCNPVDHLMAVRVGVS